MNTGLLCLFAIVCVHFSQLNIAGATHGFQRHLGTQVSDLEDPDILKQEAYQNTGFSAVKGYNDLDRLMPTQLYNDAESLRARTYKAPIIVYKLYDRDRLAQLLGTLPTIEVEIPMPKIEEENNSFRSKKAATERIATSTGFDALRGKKSYNEYEEY